MFGLTVPINSISTMPQRNLKMYLTLTDGFILQIECKQELKCQIVSCKASLMAQSSLM